MRRRLAEIPRPELLAWALLTAAALAVRLIDLAHRPYHHDESQIAYFSWRFAEEGDYEYNPLLHSPLQYYLTAATYKLVGDGDFTARLPAVVTSMVAILVLFAMRRFLGRLGAWSAAALLAFAPSFLYFSRFIREDIILLAANLALLVVLSHFLSRPRFWHPAALGALLAVAFGIKEATFLTVAVAGPFFVAWFLLAARMARREGLDLRRHSLVHAVTSVGWEAWGWALASFVSVYILIFTTFLTDPHHWDALYEGLDYWRGQHGVKRGEDEWYFYVYVLLGHEWPLLLLGAIGSVVSVVRRWPLGIFLIWLFVGQFAAYSYAGERFTWLIVHPLLPLALLAAAGIQAIWSARDRALGKLGLLVTVLALAYTGYASFMANAVNHTDPAEFLVTTQSATDVVGVRDEILREAARIEREENRPARVAVDGTETFPYAWYLRDVEGISYPDLSKVTSLPDYDIVVLSFSNHLRLARTLAAYRQRRFHFRVWWVRDYSKVTVSSALDWLVERKTWNPKGGLDSWLLVRRP